jgi:hypothetical protein
MTVTNANSDSAISLKDPPDRFVGSNLFLTISELTLIVEEHMESSRDFLRYVINFEKLTGVEVFVDKNFIMIPFADEQTMMEFYLTWF